ncbi:hypothetical protein GCM10025857_16870 [Alicyclobacillus contaminans]|nr:hypothetical protein GCM10025857_16870 [Alicyclobacillus contaminans]
MSGREIVVVLDFGGQYNQLIARRIRELNVYSELLPHTVTAAELRTRNLKGIVFSGGPNSVFAEGAPDVDPAIYDLGVPILGICYGMQLLAKRYQAKVERGFVREYGRATLQVATTDHPLFTGLPQEQSVWMSHSDAVTAVPEGFSQDAVTSSGTIAAMSHPEKQLYAVQYHPEVKHSEYGTQLLSNFLFNVCRCAGDWNMSSLIDTAIAEIREQVGDKRVLCALSGGVDSSVAAALVHRAIGNQLTAVFVDHGLLRKGESESVMASLGEQLGVNVVRVDARDRFLSKLANVVDPERKRKIIGEEFIRVLKRSPIASVRSISWCRARCTRTSSRVERPRRRPLNRTTTWAACRRTCVSLSLSRCGSCSRTRFAHSEKHWGFPPRWSGGSRSQDRGWPFASSGV